MYVETCSASCSGSIRKHLPQIRADLAILETLLDIYERNKTK